MPPRLWSWHAPLIGIQWLIVQVQLENLVAALKAADVSEHLGLEREALSRQFYLDRFNSDPELLRPGPKQIFSGTTTFKFLFWPQVGALASQRHLTRSESAPFQASELFPDGRFGGNKTAHIGIGGFSDDGGGTTGSFPPDNHQVSPVIWPQIHLFDSFKLCTNNWSLLGRLGGIADFLPAFTSTERPSLSQLCIRSTNEWRDHRAANCRSDQGCDIPG